MWAKWKWGIKFMAVKSGASEGRKVCVTLGKNYDFK